MDEIDNKTFDYRLSNIEKTLSELKDVVVENKLQARDISEIKKLVKENNDAINSHDKRIRELEVAPAREKAGKWEQYSKIVMELVFSAAVLVVLCKIGLK